ncbi:MAG: aminomethyl-transferring glycine dehydrogenase subunit GcvPB [Sulfolobales archaeon]|nr:aminomethyl-transferring glycine dehydrogenase subunit GcvPB [Sulfolobales archaeon]MCX8185544.1 aminomethyl-transferring glycine dehydrogenase subunit GcvPB [Sulfolobales archaeon]MDW7969977.1 aminomethyl-transferring glycine dehydrogenase subunit GcvPB [Sulfolobales archaeon]
MWRQANWDEKPIFKLSSYGKPTFLFSDTAEFEKEVGSADNLIPKVIARSEAPKIPNISEVEVIRHFTRLSQMSYGVDLGPVPLGSCTMKYNPKVCEELANDEGITDLHPYQDESTVQGILEILYLLQKWLAEITGMDECCLQPPAGASGEFTGALMIRKYHLDRGEGFRNEMIIPDNAHGSNPASAAMAGFKVVRIPTSNSGEVDLDALKAVLGDRTAGIMLTNPNTLGIFESRIVEIASEVHKVGGILYYDGANLNGILGIARPGDMGFDLVHLNVHKTFSAPHGGGGPGAGVICAKGELTDYLPVPNVGFDGTKYFLNYSKRKSIGKISQFYGNVIPLVKAFIYLLSLGPNIREVCEVAVLNTNYFIKLIDGVRGVSIPYGKGRFRKHEVVISFEDLLKDTGINAEEVAKALIDKGVYAPTIYFPLIVNEAHMIEFTESETMENIELYAKVYREIVEEAYKDPAKLRNCPENTSITRLDLGLANHPLTRSPDFKFLGRLKGAVRSDI